MAEPIEFYFDFSSPYSYLASERIDELAARFGRKVKWRPVLLGVVFNHNGTAPLTRQSPDKAKYSVHDFQRSARYMGIPFAMPSRFPLPTQAVARAYYWLHDRDCALARRYARAVFHAFYRDDRDVSAPEVALDIAATLGVDRTELAAALQQPEVKERLRTETEAAIAKGMFGGPYIIIDGEPFWGADRLPQIEKWLETGGF